MRPRRIVRGGAAAATMALEIAEGRAARAGEFVHRCVEGGIGFCTNWGNREFEIEIEKELGLREFITALCHEMVHVKQGVRGELTEATGQQYWKGKNHTETEYWSQPWEKEAYRKERKLAQLVWETAL